MAKQIKSKDLQKKADALTRLINGNQGKNGKGVPKNMAGIPVYGSVGNHLSSNIENWSKAERKDYNTKPDFTASL